MQLSLVMLGLLALCRAAEKPSEKPEEKFPEKPEEKSQEKPGEVSPSSSGGDVFKNDAEKLNEKCALLLEASLKQGQMAPLTEEYMAGFSNLMEVPMKNLLKDGSLKAKEEFLAGQIDLGLKAAEASSLGSSSGPKKSCSQKSLKQSQERNSKELARPDPNTKFLSAIHSKSIVTLLIENLDPSSIGLKMLNDNRTKYFTTNKMENTATRIIFFAPPLEAFDPLALGSDLCKQRIQIYQASAELKDNVKAYLLENQLNSHQIVFSGYGPGAAIAQLAAIQLMFDPQLALYLNPHRVISIVFWDVRIFSESFIKCISSQGFDHHDHLSFCSTEAFFPINVQQLGQINYVGRRIEFSLLALVAQQKAEKVPILWKHLGWDTFKAHAMPALEAFEAALVEDKEKHIQDAIIALQNFYKKARLNSFPHIYVNCIWEKSGEELDTSVPSSRLICTILDINTKAEIKQFFRLLRPRDVHDINAGFTSNLLKIRHEESKYIHKKKASIKAEKTGASVRSKEVKDYRKVFGNWNAFFQSQLSMDASPLEFKSLNLNPFFDQSHYFALEGGKFKFSLSLSGETMMRYLLDVNPDTQKLIRILFGPFDTNLMYRNLPEAVKLFRAPTSTDFAKSLSLATLVSDMFKTQVATPTISEFASIKKTKNWGADFTITAVDSFHMNKFDSDIKLDTIAEVVLQEKRSKQCSFTLPSCDCPTISLMGIKSPFWSRMYSIGDGLFVSFRGCHTVSYSMLTEVTDFCNSLSAVEYEKIGSVLVLEIYSKKTTYGNSYVGLRTFYMLIVQNPHKRL